MSGPKLKKGGAWVVPAIDAARQAQQRRGVLGGVAVHLRQDINVERLKLRRFSWEMEGA